MNQTPSFMKTSPPVQMDHRRTVPGRKMITTFDLTTSLHCQNLPQIDNTFIEVTSGPEVRVDLTSDPANKIYQFENQFVKNVSSLKNSSVIMKSSKPPMIQTQSNFRKTPYKKMGASSNQHSDSRTPLFSNTMPSGFVTQSQPKSGIDKLSRKLYSNPRKVSLSTSREMSRVRPRTISSRDKRSLSRDMQINKISGSLPKSVRFLDSLTGSLQSRPNKTSSIKSILRKTSPRSLSEHKTLFTGARSNPPRRHEQVYSNSPRVRKVASRGSTSRDRLRKMGNKIITLNQGISRISERNESSRMMDSRLSKNSSRIQTRIAPNVRQKVTETPKKNTVSGKIVVLNDSRLSNSFRKISGNALISNSVRRIRKERSSRRIAPPTPASMLTNSGSLSKPSHFGRTAHVVNQGKSENPFKNTISSPSEVKRHGLGSSFGLKKSTGGDVRVVGSPRDFSRKVLKSESGLRGGAKKGYLAKMSNVGAGKYNTGRLDW